MFPQHLPDYIKTEIAVEAAVINGDATVDVEDIDRQDFLSGVLSVPVYYDSDDDADDNDITITVEHSNETGTGYAEYETEDFTVDNEEHKILEIDLDLKAAKRYLKVEVECKEDEADDDVNIAGVLTLGGAVDKPVE